MRHLASTTSGGKRIGNRYRFLQKAARIVAHIHSGLSILKAVFPINRLSIAVGKQPALRLGQMQVEGSGFAGGSQELSDFVHVGGRLVLRWKLFECDERRSQRFGDDPLVVAGYSLPWHSDRPFVLLPALRSLAAPPIIAEMQT
jgi:hypothetical protein